MSVAPAYLSLKELAAYSGLCVRTLRAHLNDALRPLPHYRIGGRVLVKPSEYDAWARSFRVEHASNACDIVNELMRDLR